MQVFENKNVVITLIGPIYIVSQKCNCNNKISFVRVQLKSNNHEVQKVLNTITKKLHITLYTTGAEQPGNSKKYLDKIDSNNITDINIIELPIPEDIIELSKFKKVTKDLATFDKNNEEYFTLIYQLQENVNMIKENNRGFINYTKNLEPLFKFDKVRITENINCEKIINDLKLLMGETPTTETTKNKKQNISAQICGLRKKLDEEKNEELRKKYIFQIDKLQQNIGPTETVTKLENIDRVSEVINLLTELCKSDKKIIKDKNNFNKKYSHFIVDENEPSNLLSCTDTHYESEIVLRVNEIMESLTFLVDFDMRQNQEKRNIVTNMYQIGQNQLKDIYRKKLCNQLNYSAWSTQYYDWLEELSKPNPSLVSKNDKTINGLKFTSFKIKDGIDDKLYKEYKALRKWLPRGIIFTNDNDEWTLIMLKNQKK